MGGIDDFSNIVELTPEEHFVAHQLLVKMYPTHLYLVFALHRMANNTKCNNKLYGWLRKKHIYALKHNKRKPRKKETSPRKPRKLSEDHKAKIGKALKGRTYSAETIEKLREANLGKKLSEETKRKISKSRRLAHERKLEYERGV